MRDGFSGGFSGLPGLFLGILLAAALLATASLAPSSALAQDQATPPPQPPFGGPEAVKDLPIRLPAPATDEERFDLSSIMDCLCQKALAAVTCKDPDSYNFVREVNSVYLFNSYYAANPTDFYCHALEGRLVLSSEAWGSMRVNVPYTVDAKTRCASASVGRSLCDKPQSVRCCAPAPR